MNLRGVETEKFPSSSQAEAERGKVQERLTAPGPWFHNTGIGGVRTAPNHSLYDYSSMKYQRFRDTIPADLSGTGCNTGSYSMEMKRRGVTCVVGIDTDERYLAQGRFAAWVVELETDYQHLSVRDVARLGERFHLVIVMGALYHLRHPLLAFDLIHEHLCRAEAPTLRPDGEPYCVYPACAPVCWNEP